MGPAQRAGPILYRRIFIINSIFIVIKKSIRSRFFENLKAVFGRLMKYCCTIDAVANSFRSFGLGFA